ncbi:carboxymuconolactone decarboxylase family protein [Gayadomonas joobiniege]|uniref:carboxymuconolactone decarboxylase family protein n=1 Tax=Gayadomonas joobiniege TaxID=1234606 RepID=UPI00036E1EAD|nr:carboxymuconolactone decarboxylase family protein [Gayadomonas joobiniege]
MNTYQFINKRFDPSDTPFNHIAMQLAKAYGYTADLKLDKQLAQLIRLRVSHYNQCAYCQILHSKAAIEAGINEVKIHHINAYQNSQLFSRAEQAALFYSDILSDGRHADFQKIHEQALNFFEQDEIFEIAAIVINMNLWTRLKLAQGQEPTPE